MSRRTKIYRKMQGTTVDETTANILNHKHAAKDTGKWLQNSRDSSVFQSFGKTCSKPMNPDKARRIANRLHSSRRRHY